MHKDKNLQSESVLLIDDNELLLTGMKRFLEREFKHVATSTTGGEAIQRMRSRHYHIVVLDVNLPDMSGCEVLDHIRRESPESMVVIITSDGDERIRDQVLSKGAFEFIEKPFDIEHLGDAISRIRSFIESGLNWPVTSGRAILGRTS